MASEVTNVSSVSSGNAGSVVGFNKYAKMINNMAYIKKTFRRNPQKKWNKLSPVWHHQIHS